MVVTVQKKKKRKKSAPRISAIMFGEMVKLRFSENAWCFVVLACVSLCCLRCVAGCVSVGVDALAVVWW